MWDIVIEKRAEKTLASLPKKLRERIMNAIDRLAYGPYQSDLDIKQLAGRPARRCL
ncbi:MAG: hypothetical protein IJP56_06915 [Synergistaceae bacterium]|nr:hypothetical protein [Synergistaceae bacterium]